MSQRSVILIVDDQPENLSVLSSYLDELGFDILVAMSGARALEIAKQSAPDLILLDVMMPEMDGYEVCSHLKNDGRTRDIPLIFLSAKSGVEDVVKGFDLGAVDFIRKPFNLTELFVRLRTHLELKRYRDILERQATVDFLTGVANRLRLEEHLDENWQRAARTNKPVSFIMVDIDHFKAYNDHYGHARGDIILKKVASAIARCAQRPSDLVARYGGEEFACVLPEVTLEGAKVVAQTMLQAVRDAHIEHAGVASGTLSISLGVASATASPGATPVALMQEADDRLYEAKRTGRDRVSG